MAIEAEIRTKRSKFFHHRRGAWRLILMAWLMIGLSSALNDHYFADKYVRLFEQPISLKAELAWELPYWLVWNETRSEEILFGIGADGVPAYLHQFVWAFKKTSLQEKK